MVNGAWQRNADAKPTSIRERGEMKSALFNSMSAFKTNSALFRQCHWSFSMVTNEEADQARLDNSPVQNGTTER